MLDITMLAGELAHDAGYVHITGKRSALPSTGGGLSRMVEDLVLNSAMPYNEIVAAVKERFPEANTSTKSVASVACVMRKKGAQVPYRLKMING